MAYQNVGTPRFYVNILEFLVESGAIPGGINKVMRTLPVGSYSLEENPVKFETIPFTLKNPYIALLGHNFNAFEIRDSDNDNIGYDGMVNAPADYMGFSILEEKSGENAPDTMVSTAIDGGATYLGSAIYGSYYDMPNAPNLSLTMSREYGSIKELTTYNGSSMSNAMWSKPPMWGDLGAWELDNGSLFLPQALSRSGRRTWQLKFSYMDDGDLWGSNQSLSTYLEDPTGLDTGDIGIHDPTSDNLLNNGDFASADLAGTGWDLEYSAGIHDGSLISVVSNELKFQQSSTSSDYLYCTQSFTTVAGAFYKLTFTIKTFSSSSNASVFVGTDGNSDDIYASGYTSTGTFEVTFKATTTLTYLSLLDAQDIGQSSTWDDISIQSTSVTGFSVYNLLTDDNFFSQVWHKTLGGTLPFIFQPDSTNNNPDQFAICRFKENSLKATQSAFNVYDISLSIEEVW